jgi:hypothetical protein
LILNKLHESASHPFHHTANQPTMQNAHSGAIRGCFTHRDIQFHQPIGKSLPARQ